MDTTPKDIHFVCPKTLCPRFRFLLLALLLTMLSHVFTPGSIGSGSLLPTLYHPRMPPLLPKTLESNLIRRNTKRWRDPIYAQPIR